MPLDKTALKTGIEALQAELYTNAANLTPAQARTRFAEGLSDLIETFVKSGDGHYQLGTLIAGANPVTKVPPGALPAVKIT